MISMSFDELAELMKNEDWKEELENMLAEDKERQKLEDLFRLVGGEENE